MIECPNCHKFLYVLEYTITIQERGIYSLDHDIHNQVDDVKTSYVFYCPYCHILVSTSLDDIKSRIKKKAIIL